jgi:hypothetical protein
MVHAAVVQLAPHLGSVPRPRFRFVYQRAQSVDVYYLPHRFY